MQDFFIFVSEQWMLFSLLFLILIMMAVTAKPPKNEINSETAVKLINKGGVVIYDIRSEEDFRKAHIVNAINRKLADIDFKSIGTNNVLIYGNESLKLVKEVNKRLKGESEAVKAQVFVLSMGLTAWIKDEFPVIAGKKPNQLTPNKLTETKGKRK